MKFGMMDRINNEWIWFQFVFHIHGKFLCYHHISPHLQASNRPTWQTASSWPDSSTGGALHQHRWGQDLNPRSHFWLRMAKNCLIFFCLYLPNRWMLATNAFVLSFLASFAITTPVFFISEAEKKNPQDHVLEESGNFCYCCFSEAILFNLLLINQLIVRFCYIMSRDH